MKLFHLVKRQKVVINKLEAYSIAKNIREVYFYLNMAALERE